MAFSTQQIGTLLVELLLDTKGVDKGTKQAKQSLSAFGQWVKGVADSIDATLTAALQRAGAAALAVTAAAVTVGSSFEQEMKRVQAVSGATGEELAALTAEARRIGETTTFSATEAAQGMYALAQAGFSTEQIIAATADAMALAGANAISLDDATTLIASTLTTFKMNAAEAGRVADVFTQAAASSTISVQDLTVAMRYAGSTGAAFKMSLEETVAATTQLRKIGLTAEQAGTRFRASMTRLADPPKDAKEALDALGVKLEEINPELMGWEAAMRRLASTTINATKAQQIFGQVAGTDIYLMVDAFRDGSSTYNQLLHDFEVGNGAASRMFAEMSDTIRGHFAIVRSSIEEGLIRVFEAAREPLERLLKGLTSRIAILNDEVTNNSASWTAAFESIVDGILAMTDAVIKLIPWLKTMAVAMTAAIIGAKGVSFTISAMQLAAALGVNVAGGVAKVTTALKAMSVAGRLFTVTGIGAIAAAVVALGYAFKELVGWLNGATRAARELDGALKGVETFDAQTKAEEERLAAKLRLQQKEIELRAIGGDAISQEEEALFKLSSEQARAMVLAGELIEIGDKLRISSKLSAEQQRLEAGILAQKATEYEQLAKVAADYASRWQDRPFGFNEGMAGSVDPNTMAPSGIGLLGPLARGDQAAFDPEKAFGMPIKSFEDLAAAQRLFELKAREAKAASDALTRGLAEQALSTKGLKREVVDLGDTTGETEEEQKKALKASEDAREAAMAWLETEEATIALGENYTLSIRNQMLAWLDTEEGIQAAEKATAEFSSERERANEIIRQAVLQHAELNEQLYEQQQLEANVDDLVSQWEAWTDAASSPAAIIAGLIPGFGQLQTKVTNFIDGLKDAKTGVISFGAATEAAMGGVTMGISLAIKAVTEMVNLFGGTAIQEISGGFTALFDLYSSFSAILTRAEDWADQVNEKGQNTFGAAWEDVDASGFVSMFADDTVKGLIDAFVSNLDMFTAAVPLIFEALAAGLPGLIEAMAKLLPELLLSFAEYIPQIIEIFRDVFVTQLQSPEMIEALILLSTGVIKTLVDSIDIIYVALVAAIPIFMQAVVDNLPVLFDAFIMLGPRIAYEFLIGIIAGIPTFVEAAIEGAEQLAVSFGNAALEILSLGFLKVGKDGKVEAGIPKLLGDAGEMIGDAFSGLFGGNRNASGIAYVPYTAGTILEPGERVMTKEENARYMRGMSLPGPAPMGPAAGGGGSPLRVEVVTAIDGRVVDATMAEGMANGSMPRMRRAIARGGHRGQVRSGVNRGKFNAWGG